MKIEQRNPRLARHLGPYSRRLQRGAVGDHIDGRSILGRFVRDLESQLVEHIGGRPSVTQRMVIERLIKTRVQLDLLDERLLTGNWTAHDQRSHGALLNSLRLCCRESGLTATKAPVPGLADLISDLNRQPQKPQRKRVS